MGNKQRLLPEGEYAIYVSPDRILRLDPTECDKREMRKHLVSFKDKRLADVMVSRKSVRQRALFMGMSIGAYLETYLEDVVAENLEKRLREGGLDDPYEVDSPPSSTREVSGALTTREAVQAEIDALRSEFDVKGAVSARFVESKGDIPSNWRHSDASFGFEGLPFMARPFWMEIVFADEYLTYAKPYRDYLLRHEFAHCLQVVRSWPHYGESEHHDDTYLEACAELGIDEIGVGGYYLPGSYRITCLSCGDTKYAHEGETLETQGMSMEEFVREFACPLCYGRIKAEPIFSPVFTIGDKVYEVGEGEQATLITRG